MAIALGLAGCGAPLESDLPAGFARYYTPLDALARALNQDRLDAAQRLYRAHPSYFGQRGDSAAVTALVTRTRARCAGNAGSLSARLEELHPPQPMDRWPAVADQLTAFQSRLASCQAALPGLDPVPGQTEALARTRAAWRDAALPAFLRWVDAEATARPRPHSFFTAYPVALDSPAAIAEQAWAALDRPDRPTLVRFARAMGSTPAPPGLRDRIGAAFFALSLAAEPPGPARELRAAVATAQAGLSPPSDGLPALITADATPGALVDSGVLDFPLGLSADLPVERRDRVLSQGLAALDQGERALIVTLIQADIARAQRASERRVSSTVTGYTRVPNPAYDQALAEYRAALGPYAEDRHRITAFHRRGARADAVAQSRRALSATAPSLRAPIEATYRYQVVTVDIARRLAARILLVDPQAGTLRTATLRLDQRRPFTLPRGLRPGDPAAETIRAAHDDREALQAYESAPARLSVSRALTAVLSPEARREPLSPATLRTAIDDSLAAAGHQGAQSDPRLDTGALLPLLHASVRLDGPAGTGSGVYVAENRVLTAAHVVAGATFVSVTPYRGVPSTGRVIARDDGQDLALIDVSDPRPPAPLARAEGLAIGDPVRVVGAPDGLDFTVTQGTITALRRAEGRFLISNPHAWVLQFDALSAPGSSGGPIFQGSRLVAVVAEGTPGVEALSFGPFVTTIAAFLEREGVAYTRAAPAAVAGEDP